MVIHCHHSHSPISGEMKRIININNDVMSFIDSKIIEVEFYSIRYFNYVRKSGRFTLSNHVFKKYYIPNVPRLGFLNDLYRLLILLILFIKYRPTCYLEEWSLPKGFKVLRLLFKKCKIGLDLHGAAPEEYQYLHNSNSALLEKSESHSISLADFIICQSDAMKAHLISKYSISTPIGVYRCAVDTKVFVYNHEDRSNIRHDLGYAENNIVFVYSGGMHAWQKVEDAIIHFSNFYDYNSDARFLVLTKDVYGFKSILEKIGKADLSHAISVLSLSYNEVPKYLCAADVAFLLRDNHIMNAVASPTKLAEYLSCGLPVLSTDVSKNWIDKEGLKYIYIIDDRICNDPIKIFDFVSQISRTSISEYANNNFSLATDRTKIRNFIKSILIREEC